MTASRHKDIHEKRVCLFVELDPFSSYYPHNLDKISLLSRQLKLACIFFDIVDINTDVFSYNPIALSVFQELAPLVKSGLLWSSTGIKETPSNFIQRKLTEYAKRSIESDKNIYEIQQKWEDISPERFRIFRHSSALQINTALTNIENRFFYHKSKRYFNKIKNSLEIQRAEQRFNREDLITSLAFIQKSFPSSNIKELVQFVSAEYIYQGTQNKQYTYTIFPGATGLILNRVHHGIANIGCNKQHILAFNKVLMEQNLSIKKLLNVPVIELCTLLHDDAFIFLRQHYFWPEMKKSKFFIFDQFNINQTTNVEAIKLKRTIKSSYALPLFEKSKLNKITHNEKYLFISHAQPLLFLKNKIKIVLSVEEHHILKLIAYNTDGICYVSEALQQLAVSKKLDTGNENFFINKENIINLRNYLDAKLLSSLNKKLDPHSIRVQSEDGTIKINEQGKQLRIMMIEIKTDPKLLSDIKQYTFKLRESQAKKLLINIELFIAPIHVSFVSDLLDTTDEISTSKAIYKANQLLRLVGATLNQPSRGYYHLTLIKSVKTSKMLT